MTHATTHARMLELATRLTPVEGVPACPLAGVRVMRTSRSTPRQPTLYEPCIVFVLQGCKRGYLGSETFRYDADHYLVAALPMPFESEAEAPPDRPFLAIAINIDLQVATQLALTLDEARVPLPAEPVSMGATPLPATLRDCVGRLLEALSSPLDAAVLGPAIVREIHYRILTGEQGGSLRAAIAVNSHFGKIGKALRRIHAQYDDDMDVATLADEAGMSVASFHANFKAVTHTSPIQYLKNTRLHKARLLMVQDGVNASTASNRVGYESASQFSREFKRFFGRSPVEEANYMKSLIAAGAASAASSAGQMAPA
jgi:AraC-like DNA-binding protein